MHASRKLLLILSSTTVGILIVGIAIFASVASRSAAHASASSSASSNTSVASKAAIHSSHVSTGLPALQAGGPPAADKVATQYVVSHYPGNGQARVLATEADVDRGVAVYDVRTLAPNGAIFVVHVQQSNDSVLWVNRAESQSLNPLDG